MDKVSILWFLLQPQTESWHWYSVVQRRSPCYPHPWKAAVGRHLKHAQTVKQHTPPRRHLQRHESIMDSFLLLICFSCNFSTPLYFLSSFPHLFRFKNSSLEWWSCIIFHRPLPFFLTILNEHHYDVLFTFLRKSSQSPWSLPFSIRTSACMNG